MKTLIALLALSASLAIAEDAPRRCTFADIPSAQAIGSLSGVRVSGEVQIIDIRPKQGTADLYEVEVVAVCPRLPSGAMARWVGGQWLQIRCVFDCEEELALSLRKGRQFQTAGTIHAEDFSPGGGSTISVLTLRMGLLGRK